ncbi:MAG TPA: ATP-binding protein [Polyangiaceae bacterium]|jgi:hypothetical protein|nr:ATP-binding protein [Polyangiaceae bacterium]
MTAALAPVGASMTFEFRPDVDLITRAREFVAAFYERVLDDPDAVSRIALATHELLENVFKYSVDGRSTFAIEVGVDGDSFMLRIRVKNRATPERAHEVLRVIREIGELGDPLEMYQTFVRRCAKARDGSGLGLARIVAEAEMRVYGEVDGDEVTIVAEGLARPATAAAGT